MIFKPSILVNADKINMILKRLIKKFGISTCHKRFDEIGYINLKHNGLLGKYTLQFYLIKQTKCFKRILK